MLLRVPHNEYSDFVAWFNNSPGVALRATWYGVDGQDSNIIEVIGPANKLLFAKLRWS